MLVLLAAAGCAERGAGRYRIEVGGAVATVEVAASDEARARGLSNRHSIGTDEGMLFLFPRARRVSFWMKDTFLPLSIAFITPDGEIAEIHDMQPLTETSHTPAVPVTMALEMPAGWFQGRGVSVGDKVVLPESVRSLAVR